MEATWESACATTDISRSGRDGNLRIPPAPYLHSTHQSTLCPAAVSSNRRSVSKPFRLNAIFKHGRLAIRLIQSTRMWARCRRNGLQKHSGVKTNMILGLHANRAETRCSWRTFSTGPSSGAPLGRDGPSELMLRGCTVSQGSAFKVISWAYLVGMAPQRSLRQVTTQPTAPDSDHQPLQRITNCSNGSPTAPAMTADRFAPRPVARPGPNDKK